MIEVYTEKSGISLVKYFNKRCRKCDMSSTLNMHAGGKLRRSLYYIPGKVSLSHAHLAYLIDQNVSLNKEIF